MNDWENPRLLHRNREPAPMSFSVRLRPVAMESMSAMRLAAQELERV